MKIDFNLPYVATEAKRYVNEVLDTRRIGIEGKFTTLCEDWLERRLNVKKVILTPSCTAALELSVRLIGTKVKDEIIIPSFTYVSTANCIVMAGAKPIFVDIDSNSLNISAEYISENITSKTKAVICVHYGGFPCQLENLLEVCDFYNIALIEDSAHSTGGTLNQKSLGTYGKLGTLSFHETKNITCGQGGALLVNDESLIEKANILSQKGTDRRNF